MYYRGLFFGLAISTKITSLILLPCFALYPGSIREKILNALLSVGVATFIFFASFYLHFSIARTVPPKLEAKEIYNAPNEIWPTIKEGVTFSTFPVFFNDWIRFFGRYERGVPKLNICKIQENGSYPLIWPLGGGAISYSWKRENNLTQYVYFVANPVVWGISLIGFLLGFSHLVTRLTSKEKYPPELLPSDFLTILYAGYYAAMLHVDRVMYLYHALIPMLIGLMIFALRFQKLEYFAGQTLTRSYKLTAEVFIMVTAFLAFLYFSPLARFQPLSDEQFLAHNKWFSIYSQILFWLAPFLFYVV